MLDSIACGRKIFGAGTKLLPYDHLYDDSSRPTPTPKGATTMWLVILTKQPGDHHPYPSGYWPRKFTDKADALWAIELINCWGGEACLSFDETLMRPVSVPLAPGGE